MQAVDCDSLPLRCSCDHAPMAPPMLRFYTPAGWGPASAGERFKPFNIIQFGLKVERNVHRLSEDTHGFGLYVGDDS
jgi:hypothetical protein